MFHKHFGFLKIFTTINALLLVFNNKNIDFYFKNNEYYKKFDYYTVKVY